MRPLSKPRRDLHPQRAQALLQVARLRLPWLQPHCRTTARYGCAGRLAKTAGKRRVRHWLQLQQYAVLLRPWYAQTAELSATNTILAEGANFQCRSVLGMRFTRRRSSELPGFAFVKLSGRWVRSLVSQNVDVREENTYPLNWSVHFPFHRTWSGFWLYAPDSLVIYLVSLIVERCSSWARVYFLLIVVPGDMNYEWRLEIIYADTVSLDISVLWCTTSKNHAAVFYTQPKQYPCYRMAGGWSSRFLLFLRSGTTLLGFIVNSCSKALLIQMYRVQCLFVHE